MKHAITTGLLVAIAATVSIASDVRESDEASVKPLNPGIEILKKTDAASKNVKSVRYRAEFYGSDWLARQLPIVEGEAVITGRHDQHFLNARFDATVRLPLADGARKLTYIADGSTFTLIDWDHKATYSDADPNVTGHGGRAAQRLGVREFVHPEPFSDELKAESVALLPEALVGGEWCHVIDVVYGRHRGHAVWFVSMRDYLPRRVDRIFERPHRGRAVMHTVLTDLRVDVEPDPTTFEIDVPDDFKPLEHFAPDVRRMPS